MNEGVINGAVWNGSFAELAATLLAAIRTRLLETTELADLTNVYTDAGAAGQAFPYAIVSDLNDVPELNSTLLTYPAAAEFQVTVVSQDDLEAASLRDMAYSTLSPKAGNDPLEFADGLESVRLPGRKWKWTQPGTGRLGGRVWLYAFTVTVRVTRSF